MCILLKRSEAEVWSPETLNEFRLYPGWRTTQGLCVTLTEYKAAFFDLSFQNLTRVQKPVANYVNLHSYLTFVSLSLLICKMGIIVGSSQSWCTEYVSQSTRKHVVPAP